ncbi:MAG: hypothetical protein HQ494_01325 [Rhodospirillales bacterium]|nr:hypothetical protein [Rhodospirillales bacterium]
MGAAIKQRMGMGAFLVVVLLVTACGPLPRPFKPLPQAPANPLVQEGAARGVLVLPVDGVSRPMSKLLGQAVVEGFQLRGIRATLNPDANSRYRLKGKAMLNKDDPSLPYVVLISWTLFDYSGQPIGTEVEGVSASRNEWDIGSPKALNEVGENAPQIISAMIGEDEKNKSKTEGPVLPKLVGIWINPVKNAPGDGNESLTAAVKVVIRGAGIPIAQDRRFAEFVLDSDVSVGPPDKNLQRVEIVWTVSTNDNRQIGRATQKNLVAAGTFSGAWGEVAAIVADAALEGIEGVLRAAGASRFRLGGSGQALETDIPLRAGKLSLPPPRLDLEGLSGPSEKP